MSQDWEQIRAAYPESVDLLRFLYELPSRYLALKVELGKGKKYITFSAYPRHSRMKRCVYNVCPYEQGFVYFHPRIFGELLGADGIDWYSRKLTEAFGSDIRAGNEGYYHIISLADINRHRDQMARLVHDVAMRLGHQ